MGPGEQDIYVQIESIYSEIRYFLAADASPLVRPASQNGRVGFAILYTPPRYRPDLLIIGQNPGNFGPDNGTWDDEPNQKMMSGTVPRINSYIAHDHNFATELRGCFEGQNAGLLETCVGMNLWFFQAKGTPQLPGNLKAFCESYARRIIDAIAPKVILCLSGTAFGALKMGKISTFGDVKALCKLSHFATIPMIYAHHPTGRWTRLSAQKSIPAAIWRINAILASDASKAAASDYLSD
jgi:hypothetical protein